MTIRSCVYTGTGAIVASLALVGCAITPPTDAGADTVARDAQQPTVCPMNTTASRIPQSGACTATGRSYSHEDIARTGAQTGGQALQLLDPSITVGH